MKQILRLSFKDTFRSKNSALLAFGILFSFLVPIVIFTVSNSFMNLKNLFKYMDILMISFTMQRSRPAACKIRGMI